MPDRINSLWGAPRVHDKKCWEANMSTSSPSPNNALSRLDGIAAAATDLWLLVGRVLLGWLFLYSGYDSRS